MLKKHFTLSLLSLVKYLSALKEKFCVSAWPWNILYLILRKSWHLPEYYWTDALRGSFFKLSQVNPEKVINIILTDEDKENNYALNGFLFHLFYNS